MHTHQEALDWLYSFVDFSAQRKVKYSPETFDLSRMRALMALLGNSEDRGQPVFFEVGRQVAVFDVPFNGSNLVWTLAGRTSTASSNSKRCP